MKPSLKPAIMEVLLLGPATSREVHDKLNGMFCPTSIRCIMLRLHREGVITKAGMDERGAYRFRVCAQSKSFLSEVNALLAPLRNWGVYGN